MPRQELAAEIEVETIEDTAYWLAQLPFSVACLLPENALQTCMKADMKETILSIDSPSLL